MIRTEPSGPGYFLEVQQTTKPLAYGPVRNVSHSSHIVRLVMPGDVTMVWWLSHPTSYPSVGMITLLLPSYRKFLYVTATDLIMWTIQRVGITPLPMGPGIYILGSQLEVLFGRLESLLLLCVCV